MDFALQPHRVSWVHFDFKLRTLGSLLKALESFLPPHNSYQPEIQLRLSADMFSITSKYFESYWLPAERLACFPYTFSSLHLSLTNPLFQLMHILWCCRLCPSPISWFSPFLSNIQKHYTYRNYAWISAYYFPENHFSSLKILIFQASALVRRPTSRIKKRVPAQPEGKNRILWKHRKLQQHVQLWTDWQCRTLG